MVGVFELSFGVSDTCFEFAFGGINCSIDDLLSLFLGRKCLEGGIRMSQAVLHARDVLLHSLDRFPLLVNGSLEGFYPSCSPAIA
jgi:hypothetical protein